MLDKWNSVSFDDATRNVLRRRLHDIPARTAFSPALYAVLEAACARLLPQPDRAEPIPIAPFVDAFVAQGRGEGFRAPGMPPLGEAWRKGLAGIDAEAHRRRGRGFAELDTGGRDEVLGAVQAGEVPADLFEGVDPAAFFTDLLKAAVGVYYAHPEAWSEVGFGGPASPRGYVRMGLDARDPWEAPVVSLPEQGS